VLPEPGWNLDQQIVNQTSYGWQHSPRRRINQMENILRSGPFRQDSFNEPLLLRYGNHLFRQRCDADAVHRSLKSDAQVSVSAKTPRVASCFWRLGSPIRQTCTRRTWPMLILLAVLTDMTGDTSAPQASATVRSDSCGGKRLAVLRSTQ